MKRKRKLPAPPPPPEGMALRRSPKTNKLEPMDGKMLTEFSKWLLQNSSDPDWRDDPTYNLRRKK